METFKYTTDQRELVGQIETIAKWGKNLMKNTHVCAVGCIIHAVKHGNITLIQNLDNAMAGGFHRSAFRKFMEFAGPVTWEKKDTKAGTPAGFVYDGAKTKKLRARYDADPDGMVTELLSKTWFEVNPDNDYKPVTLIGLLEAAISRVTKAQAGKHADHPKNDFFGKELTIEFVKRLKELHKQKTPESDPSPAHTHVQSTALVVELAAEGGTLH